jgi:hypothetical protein
MIYKINNYDITPFVIGQNKIKYNSGRRTNFAANNGSIQVVNDSFLFSPENAESIFYDYRNDYSKFVVTIENNGQTFWRGIIDNINRDPSSKTVEIETTEFIIALLDIKSFEYKSGDGYTGNKAYAGNATAAAHQLALLRRFLSEDCIDETSFLAAKELQAANSILCDCEISDTDIITPIDFLKSLCLDITRLTIYNNKVFLETNKIFKGKFGYLLNDNVIININRIIRVLTKDTYSRYAIKYVDGSGTDTAKGTLGEFGTSTAISATKLTDSAQTEWDYNSEKGKYIEITDVTGTDILLVEENTLTEIIFSGNNRTTGSPTYKIFNNSKIYAKDYSTGAIQITSGAANIGLDVITNQSEQKLEINLFVTNSLDFIIAGDIITLNIPDEGINFQPFMIDEITHNLERKVLDITCSDEILYPFMEYDLQKLDAPVLTKWSRSYSLIHVEWGAVTSASYYRVYYGTNNKMFQSVVSTTLTCDITGLINWMGRSRRDI